MSSSLLSGNAANQRRLRAAALEFGVTPEAGGPTVGKTGARVRQVVGPLKSTVTLLEDGKNRLCLVTMHFNSPKSVNVSSRFRRQIGDDLGLAMSQVILCVSHNHTDMKVAENQCEAYDTLAMAPQDVPDAELLPLGEELLGRLRECANQLPNLLQPVTVWWAEGSEGRITYNRKGRRADGSTYLMREEDRDLLGADFNGDIDRQAPVVVLKNDRGEVVTAILQFTGHPVTTFHPERPVVFGEWPQVACDDVAAFLSPSNPVPVSFLQGCAADVNSKGMFRGDVALSEHYGHLLGGSYIAALPRLRTSKRDGFDHAAEMVQVPLGPLPSKEDLLAEVSEMEDFIRRANAGDENTLRCCGLNFPRELSTAYRGKLIEGVLPWTRWALDLRQRGQADTVARNLEIELHVLRLGDVGFVFMPFEPFQGIGRQMREHSPLSLTIPCGYSNVSYGYLPDGPNANPADGDYMTAHHRYSRFRAPYARPAGDVLAIEGVKILDRFCHGIPR